MGVPVIDVVKGSPSMLAAIIRKAFGYEFDRSGGVRNEDEIEVFGIRFEEFENTSPHRLNPIG